MTSPPSRLDFRGHNEIADFDGHYELAEAAGGTRVVTTSNLAWRGRFMQLLSPLMRPMVRANATKQVQRSRSCSNTTAQSGTLERGSRPGGAVRRSSVREQRHRVAEGLGTTRGTGG
jgi:hypothetical protein